MGENGRREEIIPQPAFPGSKLVVESDTPDDVVVRGDGRFAIVENAMSVNDGERVHIGNMFLAVSGPSLEVTPVDGEGYGGEVVETEDDVRSGDTISVVAEDDIRNVAGAGIGAATGVSVGAVDTTGESPFAELDPHRLDKVPREFFMALERSNFGQSNVALLSGRSGDDGVKRMLQQRQRQLGDAVHQLQHRCCGGRNPQHRNHHDCIAELLQRERRKKSDGKSAFEEEEEQEEEQQRRERGEEVGGNAKEAKNENKLYDIDSLVREGARSPSGISESRVERNAIEEDEEDDDECYDVTELIKRFRLMEDLTRADLAVFENGVDLHHEEEDRITELDKNARLLAKMKELRGDLEVSKDETKVTDVDKIHIQNMAQGKDKYKTLKQIRRGNTKQRIDQFEMM